MIFVTSTLILIGLGLLAVVFISCVDDETLQNWLKNGSKEAKTFRHLKDNKQEPMVIITIPKLSNLLDITDDIDLVENGSLFAVRIQQTREEYIFTKENHSIRSIKVNKY